MQIISMGQQQRTPQDNNTLWFSAIKEATQLVINMLDILTI